MNGEKKFPSEVKKVYMGCSITIDHLIQLGYHKKVAIWQCILRTARMNKRGFGHT